MSKSFGQCDELKQRSDEDELLKLGCDAIQALAKGIDKAASAIKQAEHLSVDEDNIDRLDDEELENLVDGEMDFERSLRKKSSEQNLPKERSGSPGVPFYTTFRSFTTSATTTSLKSICSTMEPTNLQKSSNGPATKHNHISIVDLPESALRILKAKLNSTGSSTKTEEESMDQLSDSEASSDISPPPLGSKTDLEENGNDCGEPEDKPTQLLNPLSIYHCKASVHSTSRRTAKKDNFVKKDDEEDLKKIDGKCDPIVGKESSVTKYGETRTRRKKKLDAGTTLAENIDGHRGSETLNDLLKFINSGSEAEDEEDKPWVHISTNDKSKKAKKASARKQFRSDELQVQGDDANPENKSNPDKSRGSRKSKSNLKTPLSSRSESIESSLSPRSSNSNVNFFTSTTLEPVILQDNQKDNLTNNENEVALTNDPLAFGQTSAENPDKTVNPKNVEPVMPKLSRRPTKKSRSVGTLISSYLTSTPTKKKSGKQNQENQNSSKQRAIANEISNVKNPANSPEESKTVVVIPGLQSESKDVAQQFDAMEAIDNISQSKMQFEGSTDLSRCQDYTPEPDVRSEPHVTQNPEAPCKASMDGISSEQVVSDIVIKKQPYKDNEEKLNFNYQEILKFLMSEWNEFTKQLNCQSSKSPPTFFSSS